ncbi:ATP-binding protein [Leisingera sp. ANG-M6]|uniref:ATP-binding protein n=2 Tax=unclassified Leisingera TaxID=2614906 RepID=UPI00057CF84A|nr:ATP-binding protein [Leisingera sp. ANG-M6]KIC27086.1 histidine kinase [Leisingera sp. ANG-M6]OED47271.1 two-component sensor histidine kinase [Rhodobacteraceae bacterium (ex Bugula neritina AB1)]
MSFVPRRLRSQLVLLVVLALAAAQGVSLFFLSGERSLAIRAAMSTEAAGRAANVARLIEEAPPSLHPSIVRAANSPLVRFELSGSPAVTHTSHDTDGAAEARVRALLGGDTNREIRAELHETDSAGLPLPYLEPEMAEIHREMMRGQMLAIELNLSIALSDGQWLNAETLFERPPLQWSLQPTITFALSAGFILAAIFLFVLTRVTAPLRMLSSAAENLGGEEATEPLPADGPLEVQELICAFNRMQHRITSLVAERTRMLAALGHDLRSPLTAMRVRAEFVEDGETRSSMISLIGEMQSMVETTLSFARGLADAEKPEDCELGSFLQALRNDMLNGFELLPGDPVQICLRQNAMRRALRNVIENALRYGGAAQVEYRLQDGGAVITVSDPGPGIPETDLERVFDPFTRLEDSRSLETGGHGLGLSIARTILRAHGGSLTLRNQTEGGLCAVLKLPLGQ